MFHHLSSPNEEQFVLESWTFRKLFYVSFETIKIHLWCYYNNPFKFRLSGSEGNKKEKSLSRRWKNVSNCFRCQMCRANVFRWDLLKFYSFYAMEKFKKIAEIFRFYFFEFNAVLLKLMTDEGVSWNKRS